MVMELDEKAVERVAIDALLPLADSVLIDSDDWVQLRTPSLRDGSGNGVYLARMAGAEVEDRVAEVIAEHRERGANFRWFVGPSSTPTDLPERLERAGVRLFGRALGMSMRVPEQVPDLPAATELRPVRTAADVERFAELSMRAWEREPNFAEEVARAATRMLRRDDDAQRSWVLWHEGEAVGVTTLRLLRATGIGYFQGAAVLPERRRAGLYRAMLLDRLGLLRRLGLEHAVIWANERTSAGSGQRVGFGVRCRGTFFEWRCP